MSEAGRRCWEPAGNELRSDVRSGALGCSPVRGVRLRKHGNDRVAGMCVLSWGSRGRRFKSGRPDGFFEHLSPQLGTKIALVGMIMLAVPRAHTAIPGRQAEQPWPRTHTGAPRRGPVRPDRWHRRDFATVHGSDRRGRRTGGATLPGGSDRHDARLGPGGSFHPHRVTGPGPIPSEQPEEVSATRINRPPPGSLYLKWARAGPGPAHTEASSYSSDTQGDHDPSGLRSILVQSCT